MRKGSKPGDVTVISICKNGGGNHVVVSYILILKNNEPIQLRALMSTYG